MWRSSSPPGNDYDALVSISDYDLVNKLGELALLGNWFAFLKPEWLARSGMDTLLAVSGLASAVPRPAILFRGQKITLPGATIEPKQLPGVKLLALTSDKALYRANTDTVRLMVVAPRQSNAQLKLQLRLSGNPYAEYIITLDEYGLALWPLQGLPEGEYEATIEDSEVCRFEVAEYRLATLNAELTDQRLEGETVHYTLNVTAFNQPYSGPVEIELQERGRRSGPRAKQTCDKQGQCSGVFKLTGSGPYTLTVFAGERTATVALKGSERERRETLLINELGQRHEISLLPLEDAEEWRGISIAGAGNNTEPLLVQRVVGSEIEILPRADVDLLKVVVVHSAIGTYKEHVYEHVSAGQSLKLPAPSPYGVMLFGAFIADRAWEGWCAVFSPAQLELQCEAPPEARPGEYITLTLKTNASGRIVPVQLIVKDQRLIAPSDPQVELAACIKKDLAAWRETARTGNVERQVALTGGFFMPAGGRAMYASTVMPLMASAPVRRIGGVMPSTAESSIRMKEQLNDVASAVSSPVLTRVRMEFPEVIYNSILRVDGEVTVQIKLGDSMTRYSVEAFALDTRTLDWQRAEATIDAVQPVYGELTVSPFVFAGDPVMGRLDVGAASGSALVEVRHDEQILSLFSDDGSELLPGQPVASGSVVRFPVRPGALTAIVRDASTGEADVSERHITEPGKLRHIMRRLRLLTPGEEVTLQEANALELRPMPGLEQPFQFFVEGAAKYPFG